MRRLHVFLALLPLFASSCGGSDPKDLTTAAMEAIGTRDYKGGLAGFDAALSHMDDSHAQYMRAALGRCIALAHIEPVKGKDEFLKLATAQKARIAIADVHLIVSEYVNMRELALATDIVAGVQVLFANSKALQDIGNAVADAALRAGDTKVSDRLAGFGYIGSAR